jgi:hypothetical protein
MEMPLIAEPDVFIRDFVGDNGEPNDMPIGLSPDIILRSYRVDDPQVEFGRDSDTVDRIPEENVAAGGTKWVYLRMRNRGGSDAIDVPAVVFWSPMSTFVSPDDWHALGGTVLPNVPAGNILTVSDGIEWPQELGYPEDGHAALIAWANLFPDDALFPYQESFTGLEDLQNYIRANNNIAVRNYRIVPYDPRPWRELRWNAVGLPFLAGGAWDKSREMYLEVHANLPEGSHVLLKAPHGLLKVLGARAQFTERTTKGNHGHVPCNTRGKHVVGRGMWPAKAKFHSQLLVHIPNDPVKSSYFEIFVRQMHDGKEVGRATWQIVPKDTKHPPREKPVHPGGRRR